MNQKAFDHKNLNGYVYVLTRDHFSPRSGYANAMEWRSKKSAKPLKVIEVGVRDLPSNIEIISEDEMGEQT
jgi:hypothetical protein